jgi:cystathionine gamma-synthase
MPDALHPSTRLAQAGCSPDPATGALTPALHLAATFERDASGEYPRGYVYARWGNPTRRLLEEAIAGLEGAAADAAAFASGMAAANAILQCLRPGDHILLADDVYHGVRHLLRDVFVPWGLEVTEVDQTDLDAVRAAIRPTTRLVWAETPSNPLLKITDIAALAAVAHDAGALLLVDGTWTTPLLQRPLDLGADLVLHSATKYLGGHSDALLGLVVASGELPLFERIRAVQKNAGAVAEPFACWLVLRGMRSLGARMPMHCASAARLAARLAAHPRVTAVHYPGLADHPQHALAARQMDGFGGMLSFQVAGGEAAALAVAARVRLFTRATSLGGTESLIEHRASIESQPSPTPPDLLRVSVGLEHVDDLAADLEQALEA